MADACVDLGGLALARHPRAVFFTNFQRYVRDAIGSAESAVNEAEAAVSRVLAIVPTTVDDLRTHECMLAAVRERRSSAAGRLAWLNNAVAIPGHKPRTAMTATPAWSFAGDLIAVASDIEKLVSQTVRLGNGVKDDLPLVYVSNPPRHGKSLLLDRLFPDEAASDVCVLSSTYNAATQMCREDLGASAAGALRCLFLRLLNDLAFNRPSWDELWEYSPLASAEDPIVMFRTMLGLDSPEAPKLLICIDEVSKLVDDDACGWARDCIQQKTFWRGLFFPVSRDEQLGSCRHDRVHRLSH